MTRRDLRAEVVLELARNVEEPSLDDRARVYAALRRRIADGPPALEDGALSSGTPQGAVTPLPSARATLLGRVARAGASRLLAVAIVAGSVGFWLGRTTQPRAPVSTSSATPSTAPAQATSPSAAPAHETPPTDAARALQPSNIGAPSMGRAASAHLQTTSGRTVETTPVQDTTARKATNAVSAAPGPERAAATAKAALEPRARAAQQRHTTTAPAASRRSPAPAEASDGRSFFEALQLLERAERALRGGDSAFALSLLDELDGRFAPHVLDQERLATRILALCGDGQSARARALAERLTAGKGSIYTRRIEQSCAAPRGSGTSLR